ncbi:MAG: polymer-forming cytoskeletal protein [Pseudomonadota bacterium]
MFGKKTNKPQNQIDSLIGTGTHVVGDINFSGGLRIDGHVRGNITATGDKPSTLMLSDQASIEGKIQVSHAVINGTVVGPVYADEYLELQAKARVSGDVYYRALEIQLGATIEGMLLHQDHVGQGNKVMTLVPATGD